MEKRHAIIKDFIKQNYNNQNLADKVLNKFKDQLDTYKFIDSNNSLKNGMVIKYTDCSCSKLLKGFIVNCHTDLRGNNYKITLRNGITGYYWNISPKKNLIFYKEKKADSYIRKLVEKWKIKNNI